MSYVSLKNSVSVLSTYGKAKKITNSQAWSLVNKYLHPFCRCNDIDCRSLCHESDRPTPCVYTCLLCPALEQKPAIYGTWKGFHPASSSRQPLRLSSCKVRSSNLRHQNFYTRHASTTQSSLKTLYSHVGGPGDSRIQICALPPSLKAT